MIRGHKLTLHFGAHAVLDNVDLFVGPRDRVALIGRNGAGKTSLMKVLAGQLAPESGDVRHAPNIVVGYFSQEGQVTLGHTVRDELLTAFGELRQVERQLREVEEQMAGAADDDALTQAIDRQAQLMEDFERLEGYTVEAQIGEILAGLGFAPDAADRLTNEFSGGWQMRIALARLLLERPNLLLLDEPTNHLDPDAQAWLIEYLRAYPGAYLVVSHDRAFLDAVSDKTFELEDGRLLIYNGNYSTAMAEKKRRREAQQLAYDRQQRYIAKQQRMINWAKGKATRASSAKARERALAKLQRIEPPKAEA
ncbi:MAG TPA: ATP-binding cassette domain-containing protein, partial [Dehalococcoidia bacterium]|nr:ATP-binding cassette domain-containing protein [Dehalococcoidia bacterium]